MWSGWPGLLDSFVPPSVRNLHDDGQERPVCVSTCTCIKTIEEHATQSTMYVAECNTLTCVVPEAKSTIRRDGCSFSSPDVGLVVPSVWVGRESNSLLPQCRWLPSWRRFLVGEAGVKSDDDLFLGNFPELRGIDQNPDYVGYFGCCLFGKSCSFSTGCDGLVSQLRFP